MNSMDLLAREDEFIRLNKQLEKKTKSLMKEIEHVMQKQDNNIFPEYSTNLHLNHNTRKHLCDARNSATPPLSAENKKKKTKLRNQTPPINSSKNSNVEIEKHTNQVEFENGTRENANVNSVEICKNCSVRVICDLCTNTTKLNENAEFLQAFVSVNVKDNVLPQSFLKDKVTVENVCKFLSSKIKLMQEQIDKLQSTVNKKAQQCEAHLTQLAELESERMTLLNKLNSMKAGSAEVKAKCMALQNRLDDKDRLYKEQRSETDKLTVELKRLKSRNISLEARCATHEEGISSLKQQLEVAKKSEKEFRDSSRNLSASNQSSISRLESQVRSLSTRLQRQALLVDNLRRQNVLLSTDGAVNALEREYTKFLNQD